MPSITLTLPTSGTVITAGLHANNYTALQNLLNSGLDTANWATGKIFAPSKLMQEAATDKQILQWNNGAVIWNPAGDWTVYSPAWTSSGVAPVLGNGTITGRFVQIGKTVVGRVNLTMGSTTTFGTGNYSFSLPVTANATETTVGTCEGTHGGGFGGLVFLASTTTVNVLTFAVPGVAWGQLVPVTWASTDGIFTKFIYEAA